MVGIVFLFVGLVLMGVAVVVFFSFASMPAPGDLIGQLVAGFVGLLGGGFSFFGIISLIKGSRLRKEQLEIMRTGIETEGHVIFVDRNFTILVNQTPIYSIVEYTYRDRSGTEHTRRVNNVNSEMVIRNQIQVGSKVRIKYSTEDPSKSILIMEAPVQ